jgi:NADPH-dependent glutamate synthase beta subunit-like oxidoreductase
MPRTSDTDKPLATDFRTLAHQVEKLPPCQVNCPNSGDIRRWFGIIAQHDKNGLTLDQAYDKAWETIADLNPMPATIGRICPHPCEDLCSRREKDGAVSINAMERFLGDWGISRSLRLPRRGRQKYPETMGVIGSGPASLSFAYQMARRGYEVTVYERHSVPGGMLRHAIPDYRLPREVLDAEVQRIFDLDIAFVSNVDLGKEITLEELRNRHTMIFLGLGAQAARQLEIRGEEGPGVTSGIDYLQQRKQAIESLQGRRVLVVGGGNTAIDAARSARRDGADVTLLYRRSEKEMPAAAQEVQHARIEGVELRFLVAPVRIIRDGNRIQKVQVQEMQLAEADEQNRRRPVPVPGHFEELPADTVIVAASQAPDWKGINALQDAEQWLRTDDDGRLEQDIWAGGDDRGPGIASKAIAHGRLAAESAHAQLRGRSRPQATKHHKTVTGASVKVDYYAEQPRTQVPHRPQEEWLTDPETEIEKTLSSDQAMQEAKRCMSCGLCFDCQQCFMYCNKAGFTRIEKSAPGNYFIMALDACEGCGKCIELCPCGYIEARDAPSIP